MMLQKTKTKKAIEFENFLCEYAITKDRFSGGQYSYGIAINLYTDGVLADSCHIKNITTCKEKSDSLLKILMNGFVTPITCLEVVDDFLAVN